MKSTCRLLLVLLVIASCACQVMGVETIKLNQCVVHGADSHGPDMHMWRYMPGDNVVDMNYAQFTDDGDKAIWAPESDVSTFQATIEWAIPQEPQFYGPAYLEMKAHHTNGADESHIYEMRDSGNQWEPWQTKTYVFANIKKVGSSSVAPFPAAGIHFIFRENCGTKDVICTDGQQRARNIGDGIIRLRVASIGFASGSNQIVNWRNMDFYEGQALDNFDVAYFDGDRSHDYVEFEAQSQSGQTTISAYCRKPEDEPAKYRVRVNGSLVEESGSFSNTDWEWVDLWTGNVPPSATIRIENNQWTEEGFLLLPDEVHHSTIGIRSEHYNGPAIKLRPAGGGGTQGTGEGQAQGETGGDDSETWEEPESVEDEEVQEQDEDGLQLSIDGRLIASNIRITDITDTTATLSFKTHGAYNYTLGWNPNGAPAEHTAPEELVNGTANGQASFTMTGLQPQTTYAYNLGVIDPQAQHGDFTGWQSFETLLPGGVVEVQAGGYTADNVSRVVGWDWLCANGAEAVFLFDGDDLQNLDANDTVMHVDALCTNQAGGGAGYSADLTFKFYSDGEYLLNMEVPMENPFKPINPHLTTGKGYKIHGDSPTIPSGVITDSIANGQLKVVITWPGGVDPGSRHVAFRKQSLILRSE